MDNYEGEHTTDVIQKKALDMLDDAASTGDQFFMMVAPGRQGQPQSYNRAATNQKQWHRIKICNTVSSLRLCQRSGKSNQRPQHAQKTLTVCHQEGKVCWTQGTQDGELQSRCPKVLPLYYFTIDCVLTLLFKWRFVGPPLTKARPEEAGRLR
jgi:hypothetical protein